MIYLNQLGMISAFGSTLDDTRRHLFESAGSGVDPTEDNLDCRAYNCE